MKHLYKILLLFGLTVMTTQSCSDLEEDASSLLQVGQIASESDIEANIAPIYRSLFQTNRDPHFLRTA